jgi:hypothetical protein
MIPREDARRLFRRALEEFASRWEIAADLTEVTMRDPDHWLSGIGTFGATLRDPVTGALKVLGRRRGPEDGATFHRGISGMVLEAYLDGGADPIWRYLQEIEVIDTTAPRRMGQRVSNRTSSTSR